LVQCIAQRCSTMSIWCLSARSLQGSEKQFRSHKTIEKGEIKVKEWMGSAV
jgi:hypothetical protein